MSVDRIFGGVAATAGEIRAGFTDRRRAAGENPTGDEQLAADVRADRLLAEKLLAIESVAGYASEEREDVLKGGSGEYHVACDPLDGSSNLASNNPAGTIVGVYDRRPPAPGESLVAAGYVLYGPVTTMVVADDEVTEYLIEDGERTVLDDDIRLPAEPTVYGLGGRAPDWPGPVAAYVEQLEDRRLKLRYGGAMVADVNQVLAHGGVFGYPMLEDRPDGKLRAVFEALPMAYVLERAGGASSDGTDSLLAAAPERLHERTPVFLGNADPIEALEGTLSRR